MKLPKKLPGRLLAIPRNDRRKMATRNGLTLTAARLRSFGLQTNEFEIFAVNREAGLVKIRFGKAFWAQYV